ncbi:MAG: DUF421 domain-containing protein [Rickettsiales bacterium]|nr:DUF421 domain-containing protein [Rickettsiales bacterium]
MSGINWHDLFVPDMPFLEIFVRGSCIYFALLFLLRVVLKRQAGSLSISDLLVIVLLADASQNAMAGSYQSITDGVFLVSTIVGWNYALEFLAYYIKPIEWLVHPGPMTLIQDGRANYKNLRSEFITKDELMSALREQGAEHISEVKRACLEGDGKISVIKYENSQQRPLAQTLT